MEDISQEQLDALLNLDSEEKACFVSNTIEERNQEYLDLVTATSGWISETKAVIRTSIRWHGEKFVKEEPSQEPYLNALDHDTTRLGKRLEASMAMKGYLEADERPTDEMIAVSDENLDTDFKKKSSRYKRSIKYLCGQQPFANQEHFASTIDFLRNEMQLGGDDQIISQARRIWVALQKDLTLEIDESIIYELEA